MGCGSSSGPAAAPAGRGPPAGGAGAGAPNTSAHANTPEAKALLKEIAALPAGKNRDSLTKAVNDLTAAALTSPSTQEFSLLCRCISTKGIELSGITLRDANLESDFDAGAFAQALKASAGLRALTLSNNRLGPANAALIAAALPATVEMLMLGGNAIGDEGVSALAARIGSQGESALKRLELDNNGISDAGLRALATHFKKLSLLKLLRLENNAFGENGTRALVLAIKQFPGALANLSGVSLATADPSLPMELRDGENGPIIKYYKANAH